MYYDGYIGMRAHIGKDEVGRMIHCELRKMTK